MSLAQPWKTDSQRKEEWQRLRTELQLPDLAAQYLPVSSFLLDSWQAGCGVVWVNDMFTKLSQYTSVDLREGGLCTLLRPQQHSQKRVEAEKQLRNALSKGTAYEADVLCYKKDGTPFWGLLSLAPVRNELKPNRYLTGVLVDVSKRKARELKMMERKQSCCLTLPHSDVGPRMVSSALVLHLSFAKAFAFLTDSGNLTEQAGRGSSSFFLLRKIFQLLDSQLGSFPSLRKVERSSSSGDYVVVGASFLEHQRAQAITQKCVQSRHRESTRRSGTPRSPQGGLKNGRRSSLSIIQESEDEYYAHNRVLEPAPVDLIESYRMQRRYSLPHHSSLGIIQEHSPLMATSNTAQLKSCRSADDQPNEAQPTPREIRQSQAKLLAEAFQFIQSFLAASPLLFKEHAKYEPTESLMENLLPSMGSTIGPIVIGSLDITPPFTYDVWGDTCGEAAALAKSTPSGMLTLSRLAFDLCSLLPSPAPTHLLTNC